MELEVKGEVNAHWSLEHITIRRSSDTGDEFPGLDPPHQDVADFRQDGLLLMVSSRL